MLWAKNRARRTHCSIAMIDRKQIRARNGHLFTVSPLLIRIRSSTSRLSIRATRSRCTIIKTDCDQVRSRARKALGSTQICIKIKCPNPQSRSAAAATKSYLTASSAQVHTSNLASNKMHLRASSTSVSAAIHPSSRTRTCWSTDLIFRRQVPLEGQVPSKVTEIANFSISSSVNGCLRMEAMIVRRVERLNATGKYANASWASTQCRVSAVTAVKQSSLLSRYRRIRLN